MVRCNVCSKEFAEPLEEAQVRSNVRKFRDEKFRVWRCPECHSLHAADDVDLAHYYRDYPFHSLGEQAVEWMLHAMYRKQLGRLKAAGLRKQHHVLDYGCGGGALVKYLRARGYEHVQGFDEFSESFGDRSVLAGRYDLIVSQDVLEHVAEPWELLGTLNELIKPGGAILIGTPNADALDLKDPEPYVHALHQPYHRHIFGKSALLTIGGKLPWTLERYYPDQYANTFVPFVNSRIVLHYFRACDNTLDLAVEPFRTNNPKLYTPETLFWGLFGVFFAPETDVMVVYRAR